MDEARPGTALLLALLGSLLGTLITLLLDTNPRVRAIGAILGAIIPTLVGHVGPWRYPRAAVGIVVTVLALGVTYGGFTAADYAADKEPTFPIPDVIPPPNQNGSSPTITTTEGGLRLEVTPELVHCTAEGCDEVTVKSTGEKRLHIWKIEFKNDTKDEFKHGGDCDGRYLQKDEECRVTLTFTPSAAGGTHQALLLIHQNLPNTPANEVTVEGEVEEGGSPPPQPPSVGDLVASRSGVRCFHVPGGGLVGQQPRDSIRIFFTLRFLDASDGPNSVFVFARSNLGPRGQSSGIRDGERRVDLVPLQSDDYGREHRVVVTLDPRREVPESNEGNNRLVVRVVLAAQPGSEQRLICQTF